MGDLFTDSKGKTKGQKTCDPIPVPALAAMPAWGSLSPGLILVLASLNFGEEDWRRGRREEREMRKGR